MRLFAPLPGGRHAGLVGRSQHRADRWWPGRTRRPTRSAAVLGLVGGLSLALTSLLLLSSRGGVAAGEVPQFAPSVAPATGGALAGRSIRTGVPASAAALAAPPPAAGFTPDGLVIARLGVDARVTPVSVGANRSLGVPADPAVLGWWQQGARPAQPVGSVVIDGHVDTARTGPGALFRLRSLVPGDIVVVSGHGRVQRYVVAARRQYPKATLPTAIFDQRVAGRLVLVTCGGRFDRRTRHYADNIVVFARPV